VSKKRLCRSAITLVLVSAVSAARVIAVLHRPVAAANVPVKQVLASTPGPHKQSVAALRAQCCSCMQSRAARQSAASGVPCASVPERPSHWLVASGQLKLPSCSARSHVSHGSAWTHSASEPGAQVTEVGQQLSPLTQVVIGWGSQRTLQAIGLPTKRFGSQALVLASQVVGQLPSQVSPGSTMPLPQAQAPVVIGVLTQRASHVPAAPASVSVVQSLLSLQLASVGQLPSQVSPESRRPLPQRHAGVVIAV